MDISVYGKLNILFLFIIVIQTRVSLPRNDESMLRNPIQDPDISSTVPIPEVDITNVFQIIFLQYFRDVLQNY